MNDIRHYLLSTTVLSLATDTQKLPKCRWMKNDHDVDIWITINTTELFISYSFLIKYFKGVCEIPKQQLCIYKYKYN